MEFLYIISRRVENWTDGGKREMKKRIVFYSNIKGYTIFHNSPPSTITTTRIYIL